MNLISVYEQNILPKNIIFLNTDEIFNVIITNQKSKFDLRLVKYDFKLVFDKELYPTSQSKIQYNSTSFHLRKFLLNFIEYFCERGHKFPQTYEMNITILSNKRYMTNECYIQQPMQMVEFNLNMIISPKPHQINALDRTIKHPLTRKYSNIPFTI